MFKYLKSKFYPTVQVFPNVLINRIDGVNFIIISAPIFGSLLFSWHDKDETENN